MLQIVLITLLPICDWHGHSGPPFSSTATSSRRPHEPACFGILLALIIGAAACSATGRKLPAVSHAGGNRSASSLNLLAIAGPAFWLGGYFSCPRAQQDLFGD